MFGGQDDNAAAPQAAGGAQGDDTLNGVSDLAGGGMPAEGGNPTGGFMPAPSEPSQSAASTPAQDQQDPQADMAAPSPAPQAGADQDELLQIKQHALQQLTPIVGHLDQSPEDKFRTTMMLIQASDNQTLLKDAYEAAQAIEDEKVKAQALLDVVNEINYFTQNK